MLLHSLPRIIMEVETYLLGKLLKIVIATVNRLDSELPTCLTPVSLDSAFRVTKMITVYLENMRKVIL